MKDDAFLSNEEYLKQQESIKSRQQRIIRVREQSKRMSAAILNRMKLEAEKQYQLTENRVLSEIRQHYSRELASIRQHYNKCISDINQQHYVKYMTVNSSNMKKKPSLKNSHQRQNETESRSKPSKSVADGSRITGAESSSNKEMSNRQVNLSDQEKVVTVPLIVKKKPCKNVNQSRLEKVPLLPNNVVTAPEENDFPSSDNCILPSSGVSPSKKNSTPKKSVMFFDKENCGVKKFPTYDMKRYPAYARKPSHFNLSKPKTPDLNLLCADALEEHDTDEIYNRLVHDRIRVLEQKEKILRRRSPVSPSISNSILHHQPTRFSEYFFDFRDRNIAEDAAKPSVGDENVNSNSPKDVVTHDINDDVNRIETKKKLLVLELSNAETQTEHNVSSNDNAEVNNFVAEISEKKSADMDEQHSKSTEVPRSSSKNACPSPIPKETDNTVDKTVNSKKQKNFKHQNCKRKQRRCKGVTVTVADNQTGISTNSSDTNSSAVVRSYTTTQSSVESEASFVENCDSRKTVKIVVNVLSEADHKERKSKFTNKSKSVAYMIPTNCFKKVPNWRKVFDNEEKMTESSYFSPPDIALKRKSKTIKNSSEPCSVTAESVTNGELHDLGYYIQKLLLMRPESIENLDISSCSTATIDEVTQHAEAKVKKKCQVKMPLYENSFDDTHVEKKSAKLPYYQNSFDDTMDAVCEFVLNSRRNNSMIKEDDSTSVEDESVDFSSPVREQNVRSSATDLSKTLIEDSLHNSSKNEESGIRSKLPQDLSKPNSSSFSNIGSKPDENLGSETDEDPIKLPTIEELLKRGFVSELILNQRSTDEEEETMDEEEFVRQLLTVDIKPRNDDGDRKKMNFSEHRLSPREDLVVDVNDPRIQTELPKQSTEGNEHSLKADKKLNSYSVESKKESHLLGWMGTTVQRTLQASAINSTSSGDSSDPLRQTHKTLEHLIEQPFENSVESDSLSFSKHFTLSPIKMPDIHLSMPPLTET